MDAGLPRLLLLLASLPCALALASGLGRTVFGRRTSWPAELAAGAVALSLLASLLGCCSLLRPPVVLGASAVLLVLVVARHGREWLARARGLRDAARLPSPASSERILLALLALLLALRLLRALVPSLSWDTLGYHLLLGRAYLQQGGLGPLFEVAVDRRVPLGGVMLRSWLMAFDAHGGLVPLFHWGLYVALLYAAYRASRRFLERPLALLAVVALACLGDLAVYALSAGDETLLALLVAVVFFRATDPAAARPSAREALVFAALLGFTLAIKLTAVFWFFPLFFVWARLSARAGRAVLLGGLALCLLVAAAGHARNLRHYGTVFPFTRTANLLHLGGPDDGPRLLDAETIREDRETLWLAPDVNDVGLCERMTLRLRDNLRTLAVLPLGPFLAWALLALLLQPAMLMSSAAGRWAAGTLCFCGAGILAACLFWRYGANAMLRYLLPLWPLLITGLLVPGLLAFRKERLQAAVALLLGLFLVFDLALEAKNLHGLVQGGAPLDPPRHWRLKAVDGELVRRLEALDAPAMGLFYIGPCGFLLDGPRVWGAQLGNESGWRRPYALAKFLESHDIRYWAVSRAHDRAESAPFQALTTYLKHNGVLRPLESGPWGGIWVREPAGAPRAPAPP